MRYILGISLFLYTLISLAQELPPVHNFSPTAYNGGNQNWSISQSSEKYIYVGNNYGLLAYNGASWKTYASPNGSHIRAVKVVDDRIFTGCYMEFGYWSKDDFGDLIYESLNQKLSTPMIEDEEFWNIITLDSYVLFQSLQRIYIYNLKTESFTVVASESTRARIFKNKSGIYFQKSGKGLFKIESGKALLVSDDAILKSNFIIGLFTTSAGTLVLTEKEGFFLLKEGKIAKWQVAINNELQELNIYSSAQLENGSFILGTISDGVYHVSASGVLLEKIDQKKGLHDNTVLSIFEDLEGNVWLGLNNGISVLNFSAPFKEYIDTVGKLGVVYTAAIYKDYLYLGTNQGLFYKEKSSNDDFKIVANTNGQVWFLKEIDGVLFCGHNAGTFTVAGNQAAQIASFPGAWDIKKIPGNDSLLLQGNYNGLSILKKEGSQWVFRNKIEGFDISSRFFEFTQSQDVLVNHEFKGVFRLSLDSTFSKVIKVVDAPVLGTGASLVAYEKTILHASNNGVLRFNEKNKNLEKDSLFTSLLFEKDERLIGIVVPDVSEDLLWAFTDKNIIALAANKFNGQPEVKKIAIPSSFRRSLGVLGFENIKRIAVNTYLIGISNGYITLDLDKLRVRKFEIALTDVANKNSDSIALQKVSLKDIGTTFEYSLNNVYFEYSVPSYEKYTEVNYQYQLIGLSGVWSSWSETSKVDFENLPFGEYTFKVRAKVGNELSENIASYTFEILRPWYASNLAILIYVLVFIALGYFIHRLYRRYYRKQQEQLLKENEKKLKRKKIKAEKKLIQIKNEKLNQEIDNKSRELAISTMSIIKKNEFLNAIKTQLQESKTPQQVNSVIKTIDRNINNEDDWKFFEDAFNNADKEFLKNIKTTHPDLTPNDLRLCAYLRLNLTSKEIAPLLNISVRSVEVKRYRLRKKMDLAHEMGLTDYILKL
ncbi:triple tyrosine motif-containing protein [Cellulophaga sp. Z1A5H]|uniref:helix-turn-helix and ligand-binding sensor domain-containing protein n=1 Tax=Cellulophaga sp. Z1A5H TaxID=2687291 RepID=UPI0013FD3CF8|nr:triple tyrosine motif-containing protein [Cellulophaga sp. Z1A5H]